MVITKNVHPAIVSEEEYEIAKATIAFMKKPDYRGTRKFALKGKVRCGNCRRSMVLMESGANDRVYCPHKKMTGKFAKCSDEMVSVSIIEGHVWYALKRVLYVLDAIQLDFEEKTTNLDSVRRKKIKQLEAESNVLKSERIRQYESYAEGIITKEKYMMKKMQITDRMNGIQAEIETLTRFCFVEGENLAGYEGKITEIVLYKWNRDYPADVFFEVDLSKWRLEERKDFSGYSHEKITKELVNATIDTVYVYDKKRIEIVFSFDDVLMKAIEKYQKGVKEA